MAAVAVLWPQRSSLVSNLFISVKFQPWNGKNARWANSRLSRRKKSIICDRRVFDLSWLSNYLIGFDNLVVSVMKRLREDWIVKVVLREMKERVLINSPEKTGPHMHIDIVWTLSAPYWHDQWRVCDCIWKYGIQNHQCYFGQWLFQFPQTIKRVLFINFCWRISPHFNLPENRSCSH